jgi:hypothetical protein
MTARSPQLLRGSIEGGRPFRLAELYSPRVEAALTFLFGFLAFMPYPGLPIGNNTSIQPGDFVSLLLVLPCFAVSWKGRPYQMAPLLMIPIALSLFKVALFDGANLELSMKSLIHTAFCGVALVAVQHAAPRNGLRLLTGIAVATIVHVLVGAWQVWGFAHGQFPLAWIYVNPSYLSVQDNIESIVRYVRRPFGLFPEPSAMSSSLSPWALFFLAEGFGLVQLRETVTRGHRILFISAGLGAIWLIIASRSGQSAITLTALLALGVAWALRCRADVRTYLAIFLVFCVGLPLLAWLGANALSERLGAHGVADDSWQSRAASLRVGFWLWADGGFLTWIFGMGPGLSSAAMYRTARLEAVWSVLLPYTYQTGLLGACAVVWTSRSLLRVWRLTRFSTAYALILLVWLVGVTVTTSYGQLIALWVALGWLTVWPSMVAPAGANPTLIPEFPRRFFSGPPVGSPADATDAGGRARHWQGPTPATELRDRT